MSNKDIKCNQCKFAIFEDYGYSNWIFDGTYFSCAKKIHPDGTFDRSSKEDKRLDFAKKCLGFENGDSIEIDCDRVLFDELTEEQKEIYSMYEKG